MSIHEELEDFFGSIELDVLTQCVEICRIYNVSPGDFGIAWETFAANNNLGCAPSMTDIQALRQNYSEKASLKKAIPRPMPSTPLQASRSKPAAVQYTRDTVSELAERLDSHTLTTPGKSSAFETRNNKGKVEFTFNSSLSSKSEGDASDMKLVNFSLVENQITAPFKYMYNKISKMGAELHYFLDAFEERFLQLIPEIDSFQNPSYVSQEPIFAIGRIVKIPDDSALSYDNVYLECSKKYNGARVRLVFEQSIVVSLFPGQVVALEGFNPQGLLFHVQKVIALPLLDSATTLASKLLEMPYAVAKKPVGILVAAGPYTLHDSLNFEPFEELLHVVERRKPEVLLLLGPFVDEQHPFLAQGQCHTSPRVLFEKVFLERLNQLDCHTVLVPSLRDVTHEFVCFPQPPIQIIQPVSAQNQQQRVITVANPSQIWVNELLVGICSRDVLKDMLGETLRLGEGGAGSGDRMAQTVLHMMEQRSVYPLSPPPRGEPAVDLERMAALELQAAPDLLILPSQLMHTVRRIEPTGTVLINPGTLARPKAAGTYTYLTLHPPSAEITEASDPDAHVAHAVDQRLRAEIIRI